MLYAQIHLTLPAWVHQQVDTARIYADDEQRMALAIDLARRNVESHTGGPFGAAIFTDAGRLVAVGVNRVLPQSCSVAHAETMAFMAAQARLQRARLNEGGGEFTLAASAQPCAMCYGASFWAGISEILIGARAEDVAELAGFDEGPLPVDWIGELERRGIRVKRDVLRNTAREMLASYRASGGAVY